jgi:lysine-specific permease
MKTTQLKRQLNDKQLSMIAIGGSIATGLFLATGLAIHQAGALGALMAYGLMGVMMYFLMTSLGELSAKYPSTGSFYLYGEKFVSPSFGFALGVNYWFNWAITLAAELAASSMVMKFWFPHSHAVTWSILFLSVLFLMNVFSVKWFGKTEYWLSWLKILVIIVFVITGLALVFGFIGDKAPGFHNWQNPDTAFHGGALSILGVFLVAGFSFQGSELIGIAAGESQSPKTMIPKSIKTIFWRIVLFYMATIFVIGLLIPYSSPQLLQADIASSPFTIIFKQAGLWHAASFVNLTILIAILSAGNSSMYASSRMLWYMAKRKDLPQIFGNLNKKGAPYIALIATALIGMLAFLSSRFGGGKVYVWLISASGLSGFITWLGIALCHYRFRKSYVKQGGTVSNLPYRAKLFPFGPIFAFILCVIVIVGQDFQNLFATPIDWQGIIITYLSVVLFITLWLLHKFQRASQANNSAARH